MIALLSRNWWLLVLRGAFAILFGVLAILWPGPAILALVILFGSYALVDGVFAIASVLMRGAGESGTAGAMQPVWAVLLEGVLGIATGIITFVWPDITALVLLYFIAFWAIFTGVLEIMAAIQLRREIENEWMLGIGGALSILFGLLLILFPGAGALSVIWLIGSYAIVFGFVMVALGFRLRNLPQQA